MIGRVVSTKMPKTATVLVERMAKHPFYKKTFVRSKRYLVDDPVGVKMGDMVEIVKVRPVSKNKHWSITKVVGKNLAEITEEKLKAEAEKIVAEVMPPSDAEAMEGKEEESEKVEKKEKSKKRKTRKEKLVTKP